ncbi:ATP synthase subunit b 2 [Dissostichus eleginoides]|uniref:ATP synthase subunit b 2 n=1 Tax=Dissostichus eleginoides TaxID=100907 RepID=A0AAD9BCF7_DISEL|nr:ATP synthase subunit b 2 [Dissostichus eleginoides]
MSRGEETTLQSKGDEVRKRRCKAKESRRGSDAAKQRRRGEETTLQSKGDEVRKRRCKAKETRSRGEGTTLQSKGVEVRKRRCKAKDERKRRCKAKETSEDDAAKEWFVFPQSLRDSKSNMRYLEQNSPAES